MLIDTVVIFAFAAILVYAIVRKKLTILFSVGLGAIITLATYFYQDRSYATIKYGFPYAWFWESWGTFAAGHHFGILWDRLLFDIVFWSIIAFITIVVITALIKSRRT